MPPKFNNPRGPRNEFPVVGFFKRMRQPLSGRMASWGIAAAAMGAYLWQTGELTVQRAQPISQLEVIDRNKEIMFQHPPTDAQKAEATQQRYIQAMRAKEKKEMKKKKPTE